MYPIANLLEKPNIYKFYQYIGGFKQARIKTVEKYLDFSKIATVFDIGFGPADIRAQIPSSCFYVGFDTNEKYIDNARLKYGWNSAYYYTVFSKDYISEVGRPDAIILLGVLHHLEDEEAKKLLESASQALNDHGCILTLDGCYDPHQSWLRKKMLDWDRGKFIRNETSYRNLFPTSMKVEISRDENLSWFPYSWITCQAKYK